jgi:hypothetical protein
MFMAAVMVVLHGRNLLLRGTSPGQ